MIGASINPVFFAPGTGGAPNIVAQAALRDVRPNLLAYEHSICVTGGFESATIKLTGTPADGVYWLKQLMAGCVVYTPSAETAWEGYLTGVSVTFGQESVDLSLDDLANAVNVSYSLPPPGGNTTTGFATNAASISTYGRKEFIYRGSGINSTMATALRAALLAQRVYPLARRSSSVGTGDLGGVDITLTCAGWYYALDWLTTSSATSSSAGADTIVPALITSYNATNPYIASTAFGTTGISSSQQIPALTTYRQAIEQLLLLGTTANQRFAWGVYEGRAFKADTWAGAAPSTIAYTRSLGEGRITTPAGTFVPWWEVRPDKMYLVPELVDFSPSATADSASRFYIERVTCSVDGGGVAVRLEPAKTSDVDALIARVR